MASVSNYASAFSPIKDDGNENEADASHEKENDADESVGGEKTCVFLWGIDLPFLPWQRTMATFYQGTPSESVTWKVSLQPLHRTIDERKFLFNLEYSQCFPNRGEILAERIVVTIRLSGNPFELKEESFYLFSETNWRKYSFVSKAIVFQKERLPSMDIKIEITLHGQDAAYQNEKQLAINEINLRLLSEDLNRLLTSNMEPRYSNMTLQSSPDNLKSYDVHSYIIDTRCKGFINKPFDASVHNTLEYNISADVLRDILTYLYSGEFRTTFENDRVDAYIAELAQVMRQYNMNHLYRNFVRLDSKQKRTYCKLSFKKSYFFPLGVVEDRPEGYSVSYTDAFDVGSGNELIFRVVMKNHEQGGPWVSYGLKSNGKNRFYARVMLELIQMRGKRKIGHRTVQKHDYVVQPSRTRPKEFADSGPVFLLACPETFGGSFRNTSNIPESLRIRHAIRFILQITEGNGISQIDNSVSKPQFENLECLFTLGDDMYKLYTEATASDFKVGSWPEMKRGRNCVEYEIHKGIFFLRVPNWQDVFEKSKTKDPNDPPTIILNAPALRYALEYMYTGISTIPIPEYLRSEVGDFARRSKCNFLNYLPEPKSHEDDR